MKLILHVGLNKTGSSAFQSVLVNVKGDLLSEKVFVPTSPYDKRMSEGFITPGNGAELARCLASRSRHKLEIILKKYLKEAERKQCEQILLSNEAIIRVFSDQTIIDNLAIVTEKLFSKVEIVCLHRNIYKHALSLYKHRAKEGGYGSFSNWIDTNYETVEIMSLVSKNEFPRTWTWHNKLYSNDLKEWIVYVFETVLQVKCNFEFELSRRVNPSLSLGELSQLYLWEQKFPEISPILYRQLMENVTHREDSQIELAQFYSSAEAYFETHREDLNNWCNMLDMHYVSAFMDKPEVYYNERKTHYGFHLPTEFMNCLAEALFIYKNRTVKRYVVQVLRIFIRYFDKFKVYDKHEFGGKI